MFEENKVFLFALAHPEWNCIAENEVLIYLAREGERERERKREREKKEGKKEKVKINVNESILPVRKGNSSTQAVGNATASMSCFSINSLEGSINDYSIQKRYNFLFQ